MFKKQKYNETRNSRALVTKNYQIKSLNLKYTA